MSTRDLWAGRFGDEYTERNMQAGEGRQRFWRHLLSSSPIVRRDDDPPPTVLELGCNSGANLGHLVTIVGSHRLTGVDVNAHAVESAKLAFPGVAVHIASAEALPFADEAFDLVFTAGVLIHLRDEQLDLAMSEIVRVSRKWVLAIEYYSANQQMVPYRGLENALFKRDYGARYRYAHGLVLVNRGFLWRDEGWDDCHWWLLKKDGLFQPRDR